MDQSSLSSISVNLTLNWESPDGVVLPIESDLDFSNA
jgi:hypothetical protein